MIIVVGVVFLGLIVYEIPSLIKKKEWRELAVYGGLMLTGMGLTFAYMLELPVPNPNPLIELLLNPVIEIVNHLLT